MPYPMAAARSLGNSREFAPGDISGCRLWLDADNIAGVDGAAVTTWNDKSGRANHVAQADSTKQPVLKTNQINGRSVVRFDGGDELTIADNGSMDLTPPFTVIAVLSVSAGTGNHYFLSKAASFWTGLYNGRWRCGTGTSDYYNSAASNLWLQDAATKYKLYQFDLNANNSGTFSLGGHPKLTIAGTANTTNNNALFVGSNNNASFWAGDIALLLVYDHALTAGQQRSLEDWIYTRYNLYCSPVDADPATATNAVSPLTTPTYDGSGEAVHPSVFDAGAGNTWNGYRYWMAMTPYPNSAANLENPSILVSSDGTTWTAPAGLTNPIEAAPAQGQYNDPDLLVVGSTMYCVFGYVYGTTINLYEKHSTDGVTWSTKAQILQTTTHGAATVSPAILYDGGEYRLWTVDASAAATVLYHRTAPAISGPWSAPVVCPIYDNRTAPITTLWHLDITKVNAIYYAIMTRGTSGGQLVLATSHDGIHWQMDNDTGAGYTMIGQAATWNVILYRASMVWNGTSFDLWYSAQNNGSPVKVWRIGRSTITGVTVP